MLDKGDGHTYVLHNKLILLSIFRDIRGILVLK